MRTILVMLFLILIGFGFLLSDNLHVRQDFTSVQQQNTQIMEDNKAMQDQVTQLQNENIHLNEQIRQLLISNSALQSQIKSLQNENSAIKDQNNQLHSKLDHMTTTSSWMIKLMSAISRPVGLAILIPFLPLSLGTTYIWLRSRKHNNSTRNRDIHSSRPISAQITEEELKEVLKIRRRKK